MRLFHALAVIFALFWACLFGVQVCADEGGKSALSQIKNVSVGAYQSLDKKRRIYVQTAGGNVLFDVEVADTDEKRRQGLMWRTYLDDNAGMIFTEPDDKEWHMWMKNTYIPLDMIYFKRDGKIVKIIKNAKPHDLTILSSDDVVAGVLEIGGGKADMFGIKVGDFIVLDDLF